jgi:hypothetical protein
MSFSTLNIVLKHSYQFKNAYLAITDANFNSIYVNSNASSYSYSTRLLISSFGSLTFNKGSQYINNRYLEIDIIVDSSLISVA